jgi:preprotein translocase subunit SecA
VETSEHLSALLERAGIEHRLLNAKYDAEEARIIATAGEQRRVTVATNMAGRGTDIRLEPTSAELGGLHVICTELHESRRIDRQLAGRSARQGDPGSVRQFISLEDDILAIGLGSAKADRIRQNARRVPGSCDKFASLIRTAQRKVERKRYDARQRLVAHAKRRTEQMTQIGLDPYLNTWF